MNERFWNWWIGLAGLVIVGAVAYDFAAAEPKPDVSASSHRQRLVGLQRDIDSAEESLDRLDAERTKRLWTADERAINAAVLDRVTSQAKESSVKMVGFRPQRAETDGTLRRLPFLVLLEGRYLDVLKMLRALETPDSKIAVNLVQMASSDGSSDRVNASFGIIAFTSGEEILGKGK